MLISGSSVLAEQGPALAPNYAGVIGRLATVATHGGEPVPDLAYRDGRCDAFRPVEIRTSTNAQITPLVEVQLTDLPPMIRGPPVVDISI